MNTSTSRYSPVLFFLPPIQKRGEPLAGSVGGHIARLPALWLRRRRQRRALSRLDAHLLEDIGLSTFEAEQEARKPFWLA